MARTDLPTATAVSQAGSVNPTFTAAIADGHMIANDGKLWLEVRNDDASSKTITIQTGAVVQGDLAVADRTMVVGAGQVGYIGFFAPSDYNQPSGTDAGKIYIDYSATTSVTICAFRS